MPSIPASTPVDHRPEDALSQAAALTSGWRAAKTWPAGRRAGHGEGQRGPGRLCHHQWRDAAEGRDRPGQQPGRRQSAAPARWCSVAPTRRRFRCAGSPATSCTAIRAIRAMPRSRLAARLAAPLRPWRPASVISRTAPTSRARSAIRLMLRRAWPAAHAGPRGGSLTRPLPERSLGGQITAVSGPLAQHRRLAPGAGRDGRARSARSVVGASRRWRGRPRRSAWRCVSIPMAWRPSPRWSRRCRTRARRLGEAGWRVDTLDAIPLLKEAADPADPHVAGRMATTPWSRPRASGRRPGRPVAGRAARTRRRHGPLPDTPRCSRGAPRRHGSGNCSPSTRCCSFAGVGRAALPGPVSDWPATRLRARLARADAADRRAVHGLASPVRGHGAACRARRGRSRWACSSWRAVTARTCAWPRARAIEAADS